MLYENAGMDITALNAQVVENIRTLIAEKGAKATTLSKEAGLGHTTIIDLLKRPGASPKYDTMLKIANKLGVDIRRITIGPDYLNVDAESAKILELLMQLEPSEREMLLVAAKVRIDARASQPQESPEGSE